MTQLDQSARTRWEDEGGQRRANPVSTGRGSRECGSGSRELQGAASRSERRRQRADGLRRGGRDPGLLGLGRGACRGCWSRASAGRWPTAASPGTARCTRRWTSTRPRPGHRPARRRGRSATNGFHVDQAFLINKSPEELYRFWRNFENLPRIMTHLESVRVIDDRRSHWVAKAHSLGGKRLEWDAEITGDEPNYADRLAVAARLAGRDTVGQVRFEPALGRPRHRGARPHGLRPAGRHARPLCSPAVRREPRAADPRGPAELQTAHGDRRDPHHRRPAPRHLHRPGGSVHGRSPDRRRVGPRDLDRFERRKGTRS